MTAPDLPADALASALPAGIRYTGQGVSWNTREVAAYQAERLAGSGYRLVYVECAGGENHAPQLDGKCAVCGRDVDVVDPYYVPWPHESAEEAADCVKCSPSVLAGTSAPARHTDGETGGGEDG